MRDFDHPNDWRLRLGECKIRDEVSDRIFTVVFGYASLDNKPYFRVFSENDTLICGTWIETWNESYSRSYQISNKTFDNIKAGFKRFEKLRAFA